MRLNLLLATGAIVSSVFAFSASPRTSTRGANGERKMSEDQHDLPSRLVYPALAAAAGYLYLSSPEGQQVKQDLNRRLDQWRRRLDESREQSRLQTEERIRAKRLSNLSNPHAYRRRAGDDYIVQAPNGQLIQLTWTEKAQISDCIRAVAYLNVDHQSKFNRCLLYARYPSIKIEDVLDVDHPLEVPEAEPEDSTDHSHSNNAVMQHGRQLVGKAGERIKENILGVLARLASVRKQKVGAIVLPGGLQGTPGLRVIPRL
ncbi:MAG: hypothetical protein M1816_002476 [Peltula sp. TS41687]|nr:MAG: hypothetical protein M1816_002476 [Peltula sp. TS41687]